MCVSLCCPIYKCEGERRKHNHTVMGMIINNNVGRYKADLVSGGVVRAVPVTQTCGGVSA